MVSLGVHATMRPIGCTMMVCTVTRYRLSPHLLRVAWVAWGTRRTQTQASRYHQVSFPCSGEARSTLPREEKTKKWEESRTTLNCANLGCSDGWTVLHLYFDKATSVFSLPYPALSLAGWGENPDSLSALSLLTNNLSPEAQNTQTYLFPQHQAQPLQCSMSQGQAALCRVPFYGLNKTQ